MAINTGQINPNAFGYMPSFPEGADGISSFVSGYMGAKKAGEDERKAASVAASEGRPAPKSSFLNRLTTGFNNAPGIRAQGSDPLSKAKAIEFQQRLAAGAVELQGKMLENKAKMLAATATLEDQRTMDTLMDGLAANPNLLDEMAAPPVFKTPQYRAVFDQLSGFHFEQKSKDEATANRAFLVKDFNSKFSELIADQPDTAAQFIDDTGKPVFSKENYINLNRAYGKLTAKDAQSTFGKLLADRAAASELDRPLFDQQIAAMGAKEGISIQFDDQGRPIINYGPQATGIGKPSVATQSQAQQKLLKYENSMELLSQLERTLKPEHVGVAGAGGELIFDRSLAQIYPGMANTNRAGVRTVLQSAREGLMREISDDPRFSNKDREEIGKALPSSGVFESFPNAMARIKTVKDIIANRGKVYSSGLGLKPPIWSLSADEIKDMYDKGQIPQDEALKALIRFH